MSARLCAALAGGLLLAGCAATPLAPLPERHLVDEFALEARFALRVSLPAQAPQSAGGRLSWEHRRSGDRILIANPLGVGLAEIETAPGRSRLQTADGKRSESPDADDLIEEVTGQRLPISRLPDWLLGRSADAAALRRDPQGRPTSLDEAGWQIEYTYDDDLPGTLPSRLTLNRQREIELRLRIEEWKQTP